jgi:glycosyltransferase involved in cell wall biosynthesis
MTLAAQPATVAILLCTRNGERFLPDQLDSIARQTHDQWAVWASDDGSSDATRAILDKYRASWGADKLHILEGPQAGSAANFLALLCNQNIVADYYSYADQDDVWEGHKLARALDHLEKTHSSVPALYLSRSTLIDETGRALGLSRLFTKPPSFQNALVQNIGGGNTMVFNAAARDILRSAGPHIKVVVHDWWTYMAVTGCGGVVVNDPAPTIKYRQHASNQIGSNLGLAARVLRAGQLFEGRFRAWTDVNLAALGSLEPRLTPENLKVLRGFRAARLRPLIPRLIGLFRSGIYRQSFIDNIGLFLAAALNRL